MVVHYRTPHLLRRLLSSLLLSPPAVSFEVKIIDNGGDESLAGLLPSRDPRVSLHTLGENGGFAKAANEGMRRAKGEYFLLVNGDVEFLSGSVASMVGTMKALPRAGALGVRLQRPEGGEEVNGGSFPTILSEYRRRRRILGRQDEGPAAGWVEGEGLERRDWVSGACLLLRREAVEAAGHFDENFFLYYEDVDLCTRLRKAGWLVYYLSTVSVVHHRGASCRLNPRLARQAYRESQRYFWRKHQGLLGLGLLEVALAVKRCFPGGGVERKDFAI